MNEQNKKDDTIIKNGVIQIDAESIVFAKGAFKAYDPKVLLRLMTINKPQKVTGKGVGGKRQ